MKKFPKEIYVDRGGDGCFGVYESVEEFIGDDSDGFQDVPLAVYVLKDVGSVKSAFVPNKKGKKT